MRVPLETLAQNNEQHDVTAVAESLSPFTPSSPASNVAPNTSEELSTELLHWLDDDQRGTFLRLWSTMPPHIRQIDFVLDAPGWDPSAIDALSATLTEYADIVYSSKLDYSVCSLRPLEIKVPPGTHPIQLRPYRLNLVLSKQVNVILYSYLAAGLIQPYTSPWSSPPICNPKKSGGMRTTVNYKKLNKVTEIPQIAIPHVVEFLDPLGGGSVFSVFDLFSGFTQLTKPQDTIPRCRRLRPVRSRHATRYGCPRQHSNVPRQCYRIGRLPHGPLGNLSHLFCSVTTSILEFFYEQNTDRRSARRLSGTCNLPRRCASQR